MNNLEENLRQGIPRPTAERRKRLRARLAGGAQADGLLDVAYAFTDSPVGRLTLAATPAGLVRLAFENGCSDAVLADLAARISPRLLEAPERLEAVSRQLEDYFAGRRAEFELPLDWSLARGFRREVLRATARIPYGQTETYRTVAAAAGSSGAVRAAGTALARNPFAIVVPCHRVLRSDGGLGGYGGGLERKRALLGLEAAGRPPG